MLAIALHLLGMGVWGILKQDFHAIILMEWNTKHTSQNFTYLPPYQLSSGKIVSLKNFCLLGKIIIKGKLQQREQWLRTFCYSLHPILRSYCVCITCTLPAQLWAAFTWSRTLLRTPAGIFMAGKIFTNISHALFAGPRYFRHSHFTTDILQICNETSYSGTSTGTFIEVREASVIWQASQLSSHTQKDAN